MTNQTKINYLNYLYDLTFTKVNRLFVLSFQNEDDRTSFLKYYAPSVEIALKTSMYYLMEKHFLILS